MERLGYTRLYATVTGTLLVLIGLFGFLVSPEFKTPYLTDELLGVLAVNGWSNAFRIVLGLAGLVMATRFSKLYAAFAGTLLLALGIWGLVATNGQLLLDKLPAGRAANILNLALGLLGLAALIAVHSDGITKRFRKRMERRKRHHATKKRQRRLEKAEKSKVAEAAKRAEKSKKAAKPKGPKNENSAQNRVRERTPSESARKREEG